MYSKEQLSRCSKPILIGILSGALELPFLADVQNADIYFCYQNFGIYFERQMQSAVNVRATMRMVSTKLDYNEIKQVVLIDDNAMCGHTLQLMLNELSLRGIYINQIWLVRHPDINRISQIKHYEKVIRLDGIEGMVPHILNMTNYTRVIPGTNHDGYFLNEFGVYSTCVDIFLRGLYRNGSYIIGSETDIFAGFGTPDHNKYLITEIDD